MLKQSKTRQIKRGNIIPVWNHILNRFEMYQKTKRNSKYSYISDAGNFANLIYSKKHYLDIWTEYLKTGEKPLVICEKASLSVWKQFKQWIIKFLNL